VDSGSKPLTAASTAVAAFVGFTAKMPPTNPDKPRLVTNWGQYVSNYGGFIPGAMLPHAVYGYFNNGGGSCYIVPIRHRTVPTAALPAAGGDAETPALSFSTDAANVTIEVAEASTDDAPPNSFDVKVIQDGDEVESFSGVTLGAGSSNVATVVNERSELLEVAALLEDAEATPALGTYTLEPSAPVPLQVTSPEFAGDVAERTGIQGLVIAEDVTMLAVPDLITAATKEDGSVDMEMWQAVQMAMIDHCNLEGNRMAILDSPPGLNPQDAKEWRTNSMYDSKFAALYYPWIMVNNPAATNGDRTIAVPPSGHMAGIWGRSDESRGVWKAPANEVIAGALGVETQITKGEQAQLNPIGVNCIRPFGTRGIRVWGARTLSSDPSWRYINVRRLFNMIETTIEDGTQWVVFEPNDQTLWERVKRTVNAFLLGLWRDGALFGATADEAFFVKCDAETNPPESIDEGKLVTEIGIAPVKPAEFVIFRISQKAGGGE
jgi:phage tail sheath protein FI